MCAWVFERCPRSGAPAALEGQEGWLNWVPLYASEMGRVAEFSLELHGMSLGFCLPDSQRGIL